MCVCCLQERQQGRVREGLRSAREERVSSSSESMVLCLCFCRVCVCWGARGGALPLLASVVVHLDLIRSGLYVCKFFSFSLFVNC